MILEYGLIITISPSNVMQYMMQSQQPMNNNLLSKSIDGEAKHGFFRFSFHFILPLYLFKQKTFPLRLAMNKSSLSAFGIGEA